MVRYASQAQVSRPNAPGVRSDVIVAPGGTQQAEVLAYDWIASRLADAGHVALTITYRAKQAVDDLQDVLLGLDWLGGNPMSPLSAAAYLDTPGVA